VSSRLRRTGLVLETIAFTIVVPGTVTVWLPSLILGDAIVGLPLSLLQLMALLPLGVGAAIYFRCLWEFAARGRGIPSPVDHPKQLVVTGLYRYVRNPMYLGVLFVLFGEVLFFRSHVLLFYTLAWLTVVHVTILLDEGPNLRRKFGSSYERYTAAVHRWLPGRRYEAPADDYSRIEGQR
jgi:protein-S-isoprenylcysteine O-methyltransferase Ste14